MGYSADFTSVKITIERVVDYGTESKSLVVKNSIAIEKTSKFIE